MLLIPRFAWLAGLAAVLSLVPQPAGFAPGRRVLLDAHNAYPERGQYADRIDRALRTGLPLAIEQDLYWSTSGAVPQVVVAHDDDALDGAPTFAAHFFARVAPIMAAALRENRRDTWPLLVLNLDFKDNQPAILDAVWEQLRAHEAWLTTAPRSADPSYVAPLRVGPMLVLCGSDTAQRRRFHDDIAPGEALLAFGAMAPAKVDGLTRGARLHQAVVMDAAAHIPRGADNFARWVNFPWSVIEEGGQAQAGAWTAADSARLTSFVQRAHTQGYWIRFYTLDGFTAADDRGWTASYNFGSLTSAQTRWRAARRAGVDFIATDHYEAFADARSADRR
ncbi:MAG: hypothetical protein K2R93_02685 [Gemmatimonadaceae bacterium]|nr:hypothetical protein [Gemmatimonadaceae bacterium]